MRNKITELRSEGGETVNSLDEKKQADHENSSGIWTYIITISIFLIVFTCVFSVNKVPSTSMEPTIEPKSFIINWRFPFLVGDPIPNHGDIVVFKPGGQDRRLLVKRVIGLPGDQISFEGGYVFRNGEKLDEPYLQTEGVTYSDTKRFSVPDGCIFVMGDNRLHSRDSRYMENPFIPVKNILAKELVSFPMNPLKWFS
ncbi:MAG: signal peptidase I [Anaerolineaceae bacterium]|nr:signal peptidase I [Anaerolineaceae bacterium]